MSILIKDVKMPSGCFDCGFRDKTWDECKCPPTKGYSILSCLEHDKRASFCPLVGLPEKHGRLIDESVVLEMIRKSMGIKDLSFLYNAEKSVVNEIYHAPTVIEAEGEE